MPREANKVYAKDYVEDSQGLKKKHNKNVVIGTQNDHNLTKRSPMTNHLNCFFFCILGSSCNVLVLHIVYIIIILVLLIIILILIFGLRRLRSGSGELYILATGVSSCNFPEYM